MSILRGAAGTGLVSLGVWIAAQAPSQAAVTAADYERAARFLPSETEPLVTHSIADATWLPDGTFWYRTVTEEGRRFVRIDPRNGRRVQTGPWSCAADGARCSPDPPLNPDESISPDKKRAVFIRSYNLWVRELSSGKETQLTTDGMKDFGYATDNPGWEHTSRPIVTWSPDSTKLATFRQDQRSVPDLDLVTTQPGHPELERWKYAMAGDAQVVTIQRVIVDVASRRVIRLQVRPDPHRSSACYDVQCGDGRMADVQWSLDGSHLAFISTSRDHKRAQVRIADAATGLVRDVLTEESKTFYESDISSTDHAAINWRYLPKSGELIWFSERDDHAHLYLYDLESGRLRHRITTGDWNVVELLNVDEKSRALYLLGVGREKDRNPYFAHLYKVGMDGKQVTLLTPEDAHHQVTLAPSGAYFVDSYSRPDVAPVTVLRNRNGKLLATLERTDISKLLGSGWKPPVPITFKARDGTTDLHGLMFEPSILDTSRRYPIIDWIYPGPHIGSVGSRAFAAARGDRQSLAELGFIVVAIDGMGTPFRSKKFHDVAYGNMRDNTLPDQIAGMRQLARRFGWIDLDRVGIYGHSGGGYAAATAMFLHPDFFKVGISESGNHDPRGYTDDWAEKFMGLLQAKPDGSSNYSDQDTPSIAGNLRGHLLLVHGTADDNVPPNLTLLLVDSLIKANKNFDLIMLPNQHHYYEGQSAAYAMRRRWDYFVRYLLDTEPPAQYALPTQPEGTGP